jgi:hypothetical protein
MITRIQKQEIFERSQPSRVDKIIISCAIHCGCSPQYSSSRHTALNTLIQLDQRGLSGILYHEYTNGAFLKPFTRAPARLSTHAMKRCGLQLMRNMAIMVEYDLGNEPEREPLQGRPCGGLCCSSVEGLVGGTCTLQREATNRTGI